MKIQERIDLLKKAIADSHSCSEWKPFVPHPESHEAEGWGTGQITAVNSDTQKLEHIGKIYDSGNFKLVLAMREHIEALIDEIEFRQS